MTIPLAVSAPPTASVHAPGIAYVRPAAAEDETFVDDLHALAFGPGRFSRTAFRVRERFPIDPGLSLIAEVDGQRCGCVWMTPISVNAVDGYLLGPLATHPDFRKRGAGKLLAREVTRLALARGEGRFVLLIGDEDYYGPLGWVLTKPGAIRFPGPVDYARVLVFADDSGLAAELEGEIDRFGARPDG